LVFDIGTEALKVLICSEESNTRPEKTVILGAALKYFDKDIFLLDSNFGAEETKKTMAAAIQEARQSLCFSLAAKRLKQEAGDQKNWRVLLSLPANILKCRIVARSFWRQNQKEKISKPEAESIQEKVFGDAQKEISEIFAEESGILPQDIQWVSLKIFEVKIDGYKVSSLQGYEGKNLDFKIITTFLPRHYLESIRRVMGELRLEILNIVHEAENLPTLFADGNKDGIFLDIGGETTHLFFAKDGSLAEVNEFGSGGRAFTRLLSETFGIDEENARILKERYSNKLLSDKASNRIKEVFNLGQKKWYLSLVKKIEETGCKKLLPSNIFLFGGGAMLPEVQEGLKDGTVISLGFVPIFNAPEIKIIYPKDLKNIEDTTKKLNTPQNTPSLLVCLSR